MELKFIARSDMHLFLFKGRRRRKLLVNLRKHKIPVTVPPELPMTVTAVIARGLKMNLGMTLQVAVLFWPDPGLTASSPKT